METPLVINLVILSLFALIGFNGTQLFQAVKELRLTNVEVIRETYTPPTVTVTDDTDSGLTATSDITRYYLNVESYSAGNVTVTVPAGFPLVASEGLQTLTVERVRLAT